MKKRISLLVLMLLAISLLLSACGNNGGDNASKVIGKWRNEQFEKMFLTEPSEGGEEMQVWLEFTKEGKIEYMINGKDMATFMKEKMDAAGADIPGGVQAPSIEASYKVNGNKIELDFAGQKQELDLSFSGDKMIVKNDSVTMEFTRVK